jgi:mannan endo-1,4-beta-mannosidase
MTGWYDLYDTDEAMNIVARQQKDVAAWINMNQTHGY